MNLVILKGIITGLILSLPFGPVGIYCMEKTMLEGQKKGYISALGMVTVDIIYGLTALLFINHVENFIIKYELWLQILIGIFLIFIGWKKLEKRMKIRKIECTPSGMIKDYFTTFFLAVANISGIFTILVIFATLKVYKADGYGVPLMIAFGILFGGAGEWFLTTYLISHFSKILDENKLIKLSQISGGLIFVFGIGIFIHSIVKIFFKCNFI